MQECAAGVPEHIKGTVGGCAPQRFACGAHLCERGAGGRGGRQSAQRGPHLCEGFSYARDLMRGPLRRDDASAWRTGRTAPCLDIGTNDGALPRPLPPQRRRREPPPVFGASLAPRHPRQLGACVAPSAHPRRLLRHPRPARATPRHTAAHPRLLPSLANLRNPHAAHFQTPSDRHRTLRAIQGSPHAITSIVGIGMPRARPLLEGLTRS